MAGPARQTRKSNGRQRAPKSQPRHDEIIAAAAQLFYEKGFDATTTQDIAERVGMLKGSLYYYIESKEEMLVEIIEGTHRIFTSTIDAIQQIDGSALDRIWVFIYRHVVANAVNYIGSAVFFNEFRCLRAEDQQRIIGIRDTGDQVLRQLIEDGKADGVICDRIEPKMTATALLTMCNAIHRWYEPKGEWTPEFIARSYADLAVAQIACNPEIHKYHESDGSALIERLHALSLQQKDGTSSR